VSGIWRSALKRVLLICGVAATVTFLIGASTELDEAWARLRAKSPSQRNQLKASLDRFDQVLTTKQQTSLRELDQRIGKLSTEDRLHYYAVLRRYHNWLQSLPENVKTSLLDMTPAERISRIRDLVAKYPVPNLNTPVWMQFADSAGGSPIEMAAVFKIWQEMTPEQRREIEKLPPKTRRPQVLLKNSRGYRVMQETKPSGFIERDWIPKAEIRLRQYLELDPELKELIAKSEVKADLTPAKQKIQDAVEKFKMLRLRRQAINLYYLEQPPPPRVESERLTQFLTEMPPWIRSAFDSFPADEARRRLTLVYRLVFPHPQEFKSRAQAKPSGTQPDKAVSPPALPQPIQRTEKAAPKPPAANAPF
jgi:hypothetical protein